MIARWVDVDSAASLMDELRRRMDSLWFDGDELDAIESRGSLRARLRDTGKELVVTAEVPGLTEKDVEVTLQEDVLTLRGTRKVEAPKGYRVHRQERTSVQFSRSFALGAKVHADGVTARVEAGLLTVTLPKAPESQPRQITVRAS